ncbi:MAG: MBL fold metallo-hydrolase, partial [Desulfatibacillaceae bacterium]|nr:MBL fold metallo-hydrolase [Desulfatibacillaceae bacterium]
RIVLPLPGKRPGPVNTYLFTDDPITLVDTGTARAYPVLEKALAGLSLSPGDISQVVLTHGHIDHYGSARYIKAASGGLTQVLAHPFDRQSIEKGREYTLKSTSRFMTLMGVPFGIQAAMAGLFLVFDKLALTVNVDATFAEGDELPLGRYKARVIHTPGHTRGSVCLHLADQGVLLAGDHILAHITPNALVVIDENSPLPVAKSQEDFYQSLKKVEALYPKLVLPAHGRSISNLGKVADLYRTTFEARQLLTEKVISQGARTVYQVARALFPDIPKNLRFVLEIYLAVSEAFTHIQVLEAKGRVSVRVGRRTMTVRARNRL